MVSKEEFDNALKILEEAVKNKQLHGLGRQGHPDLFISQHWGVFPVVVNGAECHGSSDTPYAFSAHICRTPIEFKTEKEVLKEQLAELQLENSNLSIKSKANEKVIKRIEKELKSL